MRLVTYEHDAAARCGVLGDDRVFDAVQLSGDERFDTVRGLLRGGPVALAQLGNAVQAASPETGHPLDEVTLRAPVGDPDKIICLGLNYHDHATESDMALPRTPMLFAKFRNSLAGPTSPVVIPAASRAVDYEAELAVVIGRQAKNVRSADALIYVAGAMAFNDVTARDVQHATSQWTAGKAIDTFAPCGPSLVTLDEISDLQALGVRTRVNGTKVQDGNTADMIFSVADTIEFLSGLMTLEPGDIIATGTPAGVGFSRDPQILLQPGDFVEVEIDEIGTLSNHVVGAPVIANA